MLHSRGFIRYASSSTRVRVGKIVCLGRNYSLHAREMGSPVPEEPVLFLKPPTAIIHNGETVIAPPISSELHFEVEMVLAVGKGGRNIPPSSARDHIGGFGVGLDMTLRDVQTRAKEAGLPWTTAKGFDTSAPVSEFVDAATVPQPDNLGIRLFVNGIVRQDSTTARMVHGIDRIIEYVSSIMTLESGDLIFTGTPEGVGSTLPGDKLRAELDSVGSVEVTIGEGEK